LKPESSRAAHLYLVNMPQLLSAFSNPLPLFTAVLVFYANGFNNVIIITNKQQNLYPIVF